MDLALVIGLTGCGKAHVGRSIAQCLKFTHLDKDTLTGAFADFLIKHENYMGTDQQKSSFYNDVIRPLEYVTLLKTAEENLKIGNSVVISAPFIAEAKQPNWIEDILWEQYPYFQKAKTKVILVKSDTESQLKRLIVRDSEHDIWKIKNWQKYKEISKSFDVSWDKQKFPVFEFDNSSHQANNFKSNIEQAIKFLNIQGT